MSKLDANAGYWQILLDEESQLKATFITPFGRFCPSPSTKYLRTLMNSEDSWVWHSNFRSSHLIFQRVYHHLEIYQAPNLHGFSPHFTKQHLRK